MFPLQRKISKVGNFSPPNPGTSRSPPPKPRSLQKKTPPFSSLFAKVFCKMTPGEAPEEDVTTGPERNIPSTHLQKTHQDRDRFKPFSFQQN